MIGLKKNVFDPKSSSVSIIFTKVHMPPKVGHNLYLKISQHFEIWPSFDPNKI